MPTKRTSLFKKLLQASKDEIAYERDLIFNSESTPSAINSYYKKMLLDGKKSIGRFRPWAFWTELVRGCNLSCGHCATRLFPKGEYKFMSEETWVQMLTIINKVAPYSRLEIGNAGEPTLHPRFTDFMKIGRKIAPHVQFMTFTNGTQLLSGKVSYNNLFEAGLNMIFVDMYAPKEKHLKLAKKSIAEVVEQDNKKEGDSNVFKYYGNPNKHVIMLAQAPHQWPEKKVKRGAYSTFQNNLDWEEAKKFGLEPVIDAPNRRCDLPTKFPTIYYDGSYSFCCFDFMREKAGQLGNVSEGIDGFFEYWFGEYMQDMRLRLHNKDRKSHEMCSKCAFVSIRADIAWWSEDLLKNYWTGKEWKPLLTYKKEL